MSEMDEMRAQNKNPKSTKTLSSVSTKENRYAENKRRQDSLYAKAQARSKAAGARRSGGR